MKFFEVLVLVGLVQSVIGLHGSTSPGCVPKCWDNSKYVSTCENELTCLCQDSRFQGVVLQCLYSQCQTTQFGSALHHALSECSEYGLDTSDFLPPLIRHQGLRKRANLEAAYATASASAVHSISRRYASVSAGNNPRPTRSAAYGPTPTHTIPFMAPTTLTLALNVGNTNDTASMDATITTLSPK